MFFYFDPNKWNLSKMFFHKFCASAGNCQMMLKINDCHDCISSDKYFSVFLVFWIVLPFDKNSMFIILSFIGLAASSKSNYYSVYILESTETSDIVDQRVCLRIENKIVYN